ncbi:MAG: TAXI family TRAP transporter solute-binding subunit [Deltaproteobacteria bacterium]|nr:TAXI family TRAP transporter solute-binding subunit [Deltaproteobacteria bacterium]MDO9210670.1 TAXI family TRAP transporter solute-binding subunit [Deltaproteobacteria bacterium]
MKKALILLIVAGFLFGAVANGWSQAKDFKWATSAAGSSGHRALVNLAAVLDKEMPNYRIAALPTPGAIVSVKGYATGQFDGYYGADIAFYELANDINRFKGFKAHIKRYPVQSFWTYSVEVGVGILAKDKGKYKQWRDLSGQPIFTGPLPWDVRAHLERAFKALGMNFVYREMDLSSVGSQLEAGNIKAFNAYTNAEVTTAPWIIEISVGTDWAILNPSQEEIELLRKAAFRIAEVKPDAFKKDIHAAKALLLPFYYGFHVGLEVPEQDVYKMLTIIEKNAAELAKVDSAYMQIKTDMPGFQRQGVEAALNFVPIHPGLAKYMRERGVWDSKWDGRIAKPK